MKAILFAIATLMAFASCSTDGPPATVDQPMKSQIIFTAHTNRLAASDPEAQAIVLTQLVYPATNPDNVPGAIILCPQDPHLAFTAMHRITHMPVNAPLLYLDTNGVISERTMAEMKRLHPDGVMQDGNHEVYIVGRLAESEIKKIRKDLKYKVRHFDEPDPVKLAELLDRWSAAMRADHADEVVISSADHPDGLAHGIGAMGWNAHMGRGFAWVLTDSIPDETRDILSRRHGGAYIYLTGDSTVISNEVAEELSRYGLVRRIAGENVFASATINAGYKDVGSNFGWWWGWEPRAFGWGISQSGHNFIIGDLGDPLGVIPAAVLGHMGKHGPILLVAKYGVPGPVERYLEMVRPSRTGPRETILNFAWIIGDTGRVSWETQLSIDGLLAQPR